MQHCISSQQRQSARQERRIRLPMTASILSQIMKAKRLEFSNTLINMSSSTSESIYSMDNPVMSDAVYSVAFLGSTRPSEIAIRLTSGGIKSEPLLVEHWVVRDAPADSAGTSFAILKLPMRKNDQKGERCDVVIGLTGHSEICAITAMRKYLEARVTAGEIMSPKSLLFPIDSPKAGMMPLTYDHLTRALSKDLKRVGFDESNYKGHSFRIGAATSAGLHGLAQYWIENLGQWSPGSRAMPGYIRLESDVETRAKMSAFLTKPYNEANNATATSV
jgi:hypothetical protein